MYMKTKKIKIGSVSIGGGESIKIQSMCNTKTSDIKSTVDQILSLEKAGCEDRKSLKYHKMLLNGELPYTIGGGIGQSRLCMLLLDRCHVGEVQASIWPDDMIKTCKENNIFLL